MSWHVWIAFVAGVLVLLVLDLVLLHRKPHEIGFREAALESAGWIALGLGFAGVVAWLQGGHAAQDYLTGYLIEKSLSVDNLFVFVLIFQYFQVPPAFQHRVLFYGIFGALVFRGVFIAVGVWLLAHFSWLAFVLGAFLLYTSARLAVGRKTEVHPAHNPVLRVLTHVLPMTRDYHGPKLVVRSPSGAWCATPLCAVLAVVETTDIVFAADSIPAIFGVTRDPFLVFSSNAMALLGLRALYFVLADVMGRFRYLQLGLAVVLGIIGVKLIYEELVHIDVLPDALVWHVPPWAPLILVAVVLGGAIVASVASGPPADPEPSG